MELPIFIVDAFTDKPFQGNPAAVCLPDQELSDDVMQSMGTEMNLSETVFVQKLNPKDSFEKSNMFSIRWFTPKKEVPLCGHATVAASKTLFQCCGNKNQKISYKCLIGLVHASQDEDGNIVLDFPNHNPEKVDVNDTKTEEFLQVASCGYEVVDVQYSSPTKKMLVRLADSVNRSQFESLYPDVKRLHKLLPDIDGLILTVRGSSLDDKGTPYDFFSRYFAPWDGVDEDPVCGSAHAVLTPYWGRILGKTQLYARQCSLRGGELSLRVRDKERVNIGGKARVVLKGTFIV